MSDMQSYDFCRPGRLSVEQEHLLESWTAHFCELLPEALDEFLGVKLRLEYSGFDVQVANDAITRFPDPSLGFRCNSSGMNHSSLLVFPRPIALAIITKMFETGDAEDEQKDAKETKEGEEAEVKELEDRELTRVEVSLCEPVFNTFARVLGQAWTSPGSVTFDLESIDERPTRTRMFEIQDRLLCISFKVTNNDGEDTCAWYFPLEEFSDLLASALQPRSESSEALRAMIEQRVSDVRLPFVVRLGEARVSFSHLARMAPGDVIVLDQRIHEPVSCSIAGRERFMGLPGCTGRTQVFQVTETVEGAAK